VVRKSGFKSRASANWLVGHLPCHPRTVRRKLHAGKGGRKMGRFLATLATVTDATTARAEWQIKVYISANFGEFGSRSVLRKAE
jgi:hypothetical protein